MKTKIITLLFTLITCNNYAQKIERGETFDVLKQYKNNIEAKPTSRMSSSIDITNDGVIFVDWESNKYNAKWQDNNLFFFWMRGIAIVSKSLVNESNEIYHVNIIAQQKEADNITLLKNTFALWILNNDDLGEEPPIISLQNWDGVLRPNQILIIAPLPSKYENNIDLFFKESNAVTLEEKIDLWNNQIKSNFTDTHTQLTISASPLLPIDNFGYDKVGNRINRNTPIILSARTLMTDDEPETVVIEETKQRDIKIYSSIQSSITVELSSIENINSGYIYIYSFPDGKLITKKNIENNREDIDISKNFASIYVLVLDIDGTRTSYKLAK